MRVREVALAVSLLAAMPLMAADHSKTAIVVRMELVRCSGAEPESFKTLMAGRSDTRDMGVCREYMLRTDRVVYTIRSRRDILLPVGEDVRFRLARKEMLVRGDDSDELKFFVAGMVMAGEEPVRPMANGRKCLDMTGEIVACGE